MPTTPRGRPQGPYPRGELDPDYARAYAGLAWTYLQNARTTGLDEAYDHALAHARKGVRINPASHSN